MRIGIFRDHFAIVIILAVGLALGALILTIEPHAAVDEHGAEEAAFERGPHNGRLLRDGDFALEITIFEDGVPPEFHIYAYRDNAPTDPKTVKLTIELGRLGGATEIISFVPQDGYLRGEQYVAEPHSFDVKVTAQVGGATHNWSYASYEGRVDITPEAAAANGIGTERAGQGQIRETVRATGQIIFDPARSAQIRARFPGVLRELRKNLGDSVAKGDILAMVESNDTLQAYAVRSPIDGIIVAQNAALGETIADLPIMSLADFSRVIAELHVFPRDIGRLALGQPAVIRAVDGGAQADGTVAMILPTTHLASQAIPVRVLLENQGLSWRPGMHVEADITTAMHEVPLAVRTSGLQTFRDFTVVFAKVGDTYEVRMLELGARDDDYAEVLGGILPGTEYVAVNSYLIKADIEKSGASHDH